MKDTASKPLPCEQYCVACSELLRKENSDGFCNEHCRAAYEWKQAHKRKRPNDGLLRLTIEPLGDYLVIKCADCGGITTNEYLGTIHETVSLSMRITCRRCNLSEVRKLLEPDWKGLPDTPELDGRDEASLLGIVEGGFQV